MNERWQLIVVASMVTVVFSPLIGCNSRLSQMEEMKRRAIRRPKDPEDEPQVATKNKAPKKAPEIEKLDTPKAPSPASKLSESPKNPPPKPAERSRPENTVEQRAWALENLSTISEALLAYLDDKSVYMHPSIRDGADVPLLSWRVALLPYLGHQELYDKFDQSQPWDSKTNIALLDEIPEVYQSAERSGNTTNFLAPVGSTTLFNKSYDPIPKIRIEDGLNNTIAVIEVDDGLAVPWTKPVDFDADGEPRGLGQKRSDGIFVAFGDGTVRRIPQAVNPSEFVALLTMDGGELVTMAKVSFAVAPDPSRTTDKDSSTELAGLGGLGENRSMGEDATVDPNPMQLQVAEMVVDERPPAPPESSLAKSRKLFREIYGEKYSEANTEEAKKELAEELYRKSTDMQEDLNGRFVVLQAARVIATEVRAVQLTNDIIRDLARSYRLDDYPLKVELLRAVGARLAESEVEMAIAVAKAGMKRDDYETSSDILRWAIAATHDDRDSRTQRGTRSDVNNMETELTALRRRVERAKLEYRKFRSEMETVHGNSPESNTIAGRYLCLVKEEWLKGLPLLAKGADEELREIAELELANSPSPQQRLHIGDAWWNFGKEHTAYREVAWRHATLWLLAAENSLPDGLQRVKAEMRINEVSNELGANVVDEIRGMLAVDRRGRRNGKW